MELNFKTKKVTDKRRNNKLAKQEHDEGYQKFYQAIQSNPTLTVYAKPGGEIDGKQKLVDSETAILIWVFEALQLNRWIDLNFISSNTSNVQSEVLIWYRSNSELGKASDIYNHFSEVTDSSTSNAERPFVYVIEKHWFIYGLSSILRFLLKYSIAKIELLSIVDREHENLQRLKTLLGFRGGCLQACAEVSIWTKFCEVDIVDTLRNLNTLDTVTDDNDCRNIGTISIIDEPLNCIPVDLARFEYHLRRPVKIHNIRKEKQLMQQEGVANGEPETTDELELEHMYAEGPYLLLSDVILYPCISTVMTIFGEEIFQQHLPRTYKWLSEVKHQFKLKGSSQIHAQINSEGKLVDLSMPNSKKSPSRWQMPIIPDESLYKSDPARYKPTLRLFTRQYDVKDALDSFCAAQISTFEVGRVVKNVNWDEVPLLAHPEGGQMPVNRREKKCQQLSSMVVEVLQVVEKKLKQSNSSFSLRIVDFCSGGGHVGILLAWLLPKCQIILVENKEESLRRGRERIERLGLTNVTMCQCNLDYFDGHFDIGVALHACGTATDLVLSKCIAAKASFVCCPCCYGAIQSNHMLHYPRSSTFQTSNISLRHYFILAHASDQTHDEKNEKTEQGRICMRIIDTDRCLNAQENGYQVHLTQIVPETASPKNHILVGINFTVK